MRRFTETHGLWRAAACAVAVALVASASAAAAAFTGATVPHQTDTVNKHRIAAVTVSCPTGAIGSCTGKLVLKTSNKVRQGSSKRTLKLGSANFSIAPGQSSKINVKLSSAGYKLVKKNGTLTPKAVATSTDATGAHATNSTKIKLKKKSSGNTSPAPQCGLYGCTT